MRQYYRCDLGIDGNCWYLLERGRNLHDGISGFGRTIKEAVKDFCRNYDREPLFATEIPYDITPEDYKSKMPNGEGEV